MAYENRIKSYILSIQYPGEMQINVGFATCILMTNTDLNDCILRVSQTFGKKIPD